jgi:hypothetical protein
MRKLGFLLGLLWHEFFHGKPITKEELKDSEPYGL